MTKLFKAVISLFRLYSKTKNFQIAYKLLPEIFTPSINSDVKTRNSEILFPGYDKRFTDKQIGLFKKHGELLLKFIKARNVSFVAPKGETEIVAIQLNGKEVFLQAFDYNSLKVIEEIFIDQLYDFTDHEQYVVCDVGMNVGAASLFFSSLDNVAKVYGYEPFANTFASANENILMNPGLKTKIETFNYGLGKDNKQLEVPDPVNGFLGGTTTDFVIEQLPDNLRNSSVNIQIKNVCEELEKIKKKHPTENIVLKLDCEGAEYEIIQALHEQSMINDVSLYMIEYHLKGKKELIRILSQYQFIIMSPTSEDVNPYGMLYAIRR